MIITDRDVPVAKLESVQRPSEGEAHGRMERLIRAGIARGPIKPLAKDWFKKHPRIKPPPRVDIAKMILEERESSW